MELAGAIKDDLEWFLLSVKENDKYKYQELINTMFVRGDTFLEIDYLDLEHVNPQKADELRNHPEDILDGLREATLRILGRFQYDYSVEIEKELTIRIKNFIDKKGIREINTDVIDKLISVSGMVVRTSEVKPLSKKLAYMCNECDTLTEALLKGFIIKKPSQCSKCSNKSLEVRPDMSEFVDFQFVRIQELPEDLPAGQLPKYIEVIVKGNLVDVARPGDRVLLTGLARTEQDSKNDQIWHMRLEGNNVEYLGGLDSKSDNLAITEFDEQKIHEIAAKPDAYDRLISSFAPNIYGHEIIKESILLLIVGSVARKTARSRRGDINLFLIGDPGTGKSELLKFAANIAPRGIYTSGRGTTAAGLTAAVIKDKADMMVLEAGATVLGDQGMVCIDEMDKIKDEDRSALHEVMEQQTCSVAKGGIVATLNARTSILAAGNPQGGKYDTTKTVAENIHPIPVPLLTRFDVIHIVMDKVNTEFDTQVTDHILKDMEHESKGAINLDLLRKYLSYTKKKEPKLSSEAIELLGTYYKKMRSVDTDGMITVTPRQLEGLVRLATARAKLLLKESVDETDAERAIYLVSKSLETIGIDVKAGTVVVEKKESKDNAFYRILNEMREPLLERDLVALLMNEGYLEHEAKQRIAKASQMGQLMTPKSGYYERA